MIRLKQLERGKLVCFEGIDFKKPIGGKKIKEEKRMNLKPLQTLTRKFVCFEGKRHFEETSGRKNNLNRLKHDRGN